MLSRAKSWCTRGILSQSILFIIVMDAVSEYVRHDVPWDMLYADDLILSDICKG